jgi:hypothetical protein
MDCSSEIILNIEPLINFILSFGSEIFIAIVGALIAIYIDSLRDPKLKIIHDESADTKFERDPFGTVKIFHLYAINEPINPLLKAFRLKRKTAENCKVRLKFLKEGKEIYNIVGRWVSTPEPIHSTGSELVSRVYFGDAISIVAGNREGIDIFIQTKGKASYFNNDYGKDRDWFSSDRRLDKGMYKVVAEITTNDGSKFVNTFQVYVGKEINESYIRADK